MYRSNYCVSVIIHRHASTLDVLVEKFACLTLHGSVVRWLVANVLSYVVNLVSTLGPGFEFTSAHKASLVKLKLAVEFE